jgi:polysaccharide export outer membrane protein
MIKLQHIFFVLLIWSLASSCGSQYREMLYFRTDESVRQVDSSIFSVQNYSPLKIQKNDILSITVKSFDLELSLPFNIATDRSGMTQITSPFNTFQVDEKGNIDYPVLGSLHLEGKTINEAKDTLTTLLKDYLEDPSVNMRVINFKVSVLGEVNSPGIYTIESDRVTLLEAIARAKDLTPYANAKNILVIREQNSSRTVGEINLQSTSFISSDFYYLRQGDVVYVEPRKNKQAVVRDNASEYIPLIAAGVQAAVGIATIILLSNR